jgi:hypothetical protein
MAFNSCPPSFYTDKIERFHCSFRNHCGSNDQLAVGHCLSAIERISRTQLALTLQLLRITKTFVYQGIKKRCLNEV